MNVKSLIACISVTLCLTGCLSIETAKVGPTNVDHVVINNYGWKFFDWIPIGCGNASEDALTSFVLFRDDVTVDKIQARFVKYANGREIDCPVWTVEDYQVVTVFGIPIPYIITYKEYTLSGTLK